MSELTLWKNQQMNKLRKDMDSLFIRLLSDFGTAVVPAEAGGPPPLDLAETSDSVVVQAELPGIDPEDLVLSISNDTLVISGKKREYNRKTRAYYHKIEKRFASFTRSVRLPCRVKLEGIKATYKNGILYVVMPKWKPQKKRVIKIRVMQGR